MKKIIQTTIGIVLAGLILFAARIAYLNYMSEVVVEQMSHFSEDLLATNKARQEAIAAQAEQQRLVKEQAAGEERRQQQIKQQRQAAFDSLYQAPEGCEVFQSDKHMAECVNHRMRAKREFEADYQWTAVESSADQQGVIRYSGAPATAQ